MEPVGIRSPDQPTRAHICTPETTTNTGDSAHSDENSSHRANTTSSDLKHVEPHPHETSVDYNMRVQWNRPGKF